MKLHPDELLTDHELTAGELLAGYCLALLAAIAYAVGAGIGAAGYLFVGLPCTFARWVWFTISKNDHRRVLLLCLGCSFAGTFLALAVGYFVSWYFYLI